MIKARSFLYKKSILVKQSLSSRELLEFEKFCSLAEALHQDGNKLFCQEESARAIDDSAYHIYDVMLSEIHCAKPDPDRKQ